MAFYDKKAVLFLRLIFCLIYSQQFPAVKYVLLNVNIWLLHWEAQVQQELCQVGWGCENWMLLISTFGTLGKNRSFQNRRDHRLEF